MLYVELGFPTRQALNMATDALTASGSKSANTVRDPQTLAELKETGDLFMITHVSPTQCYILLSEGDKHYLQALDLYPETEAD